MVSDVQDRLQALFPVHYRSGNILLINADCTEVMKHIRDGEFELSCVDPPYGINKDGQVKTTGSNGGRKAHEFKGWDSAIPSGDYFSELYRVSKNQIIWGANYMTEFIPPSMGWILWDKGQRINQSDGELAFSSFQCALRVFTLNRVALLVEGTIHPTQKPVKLYEWLLTNYAKPGQRILDTHGGSMSIAIACYNLGYSLTLCELVEDYYKAGVARFEQHKAQGSLFMPDTVRDVYEQTDFLEGATE